MSFSVKISIVVDKLMKCVYFMSHLQQIQFLQVRQARLESFRLDSRKGETTQNFIRQINPGTVFFFFTVITLPLLPYYCSDITLHLLPSYLEKKDGHCHASQGLGKKTKTCHRVSKCNSDCRYLGGNSSHTQDTETLSF